MTSERRVRFTPGWASGGALAGALVTSTLMSLVQGYRWVERTSESGGLVFNLIWFFRFLVENLLMSPWGLLGALAGVAVSLLWSARRSEGTPRLPGS